MAETKTIIAEIKGDAFDMDEEKVKKIVTKFFKACAKQDATTVEVTHAIATIQDFVLDETGMLGVSQRVIDTLRKGM